MIPTTPGEYRWKATPNSRRHLVELVPAEDPHTGEATLWARGYDIQGPVRELGGMFEPIIPGTFLEVFSEAFRALNNVAVQHAITHK